MARDEDGQSRHVRWAHLRFSIIGPLLASPPARGELTTEIAQLATKWWKHPVNGKQVRFAFSTIERWLHKSRGERTDPVAALRRRVRKDSGRQRVMSERQREALGAQYRQHRRWSYQLHADNLFALCAEDKTLGPAPSYATVRRYMKAHGLLRMKVKSGTPGAERAQARLDAREVRSFEAEYVSSLWHLDFHCGRRKVLLPDARWEKPVLLGILDDHSRLCCHVQWYLAENAENLVHGLSQAIQKRGLPRALLSDNGGAMIAAETVEGLGRLGIVHERTLAESPYQNGKQENFWGQVEGRLMAMLEGVGEVTLALLNEVTQAWAEMEYQRKVHSEIGMAPLRRFLDGKAVSRPSPSSDELRLAFMAQEGRTQRRSDGTVSVQGVRFELPSRYRQLERVTIRYASWDLSVVVLCDERSGTVLCRIYPVDKLKNADGRRRSLGAIAQADAATTAMAMPPPSEAAMPPLLRRLVAEYAATGLPPAYLPKDENTAADDVTSTDTTNTDTSEEDIS
jgi:transposase InsO family protein